MTSIRKIRRRAGRRSRWPYLMRRARLLRVADYATPLSLVTRRLALLEAEIEWWKASQDIRDQIDELFRKFAP